MIPNQFSVPGQVILGSLKKQCWVVFREVGIDDNIKADLKTVAMTGSNKELPNQKWEEIEKGVTP